MPVRAVVYDRKLPVCGSHVAPVEVEIAPQPSDVHRRRAGLAGEIVRLEPRVRIGGDPTVAEFTRGLAYPGAIGGNVNRNRIVEVDKMTVAMKKFDLATLQKAYEGK